MAVAHRLALSFTMAATILLSMQIQSSKKSEKFVTRSNESVKTIPGSFLSLVSRYRRNIAIGSFSVSQSLRKEKPAV